MDDIDPVAAPADGDGDRIWALLDRFLAGECTSDEAEEVRAWLAADPGRRELLESVRRIRGIAADRPPARSAEAAWRRAVDELQLGAGTTGAVTFPPRSAKPRFDLQTSPRRTPARVAVRAAAVLALIVGGAVVWQVPRHGEPAAPEPPATLAQYVTQRGQRLSLRLADGTLVILAPGSTLRKPATYGAGQRTVHLDGEAYFGVAHDPARPFTVHTERVVARDLGTRFVVRAYPDAPTDVVVAEGLVAVRVAPTAPDSTPSDSLLLERGHRGRIRRDGGLELTRGVALDRYFAWTEGRVVFRDTPLREVARELARWYDVEIRLADPALGARRLTASLEEQPIAEVFARIAGPLGLEIEQTGRRYTLQAR